MQLHSLYQVYLKHPMICIDTRKITPGCLFFALKGPNFNGNAFTNEALEKGAQWVIIDEEAYKISEQCILVDDVLNSGVTLSAALREVLNHSPKSIRTAVLANRDHHKFPIQANYVGISLATTLQENISYQVTDDQMSVWLG